MRIISIIIIIILAIQVNRFRCHCVYFMYDGVHVHMYINIIRWAVGAGFMMQHDLFFLAAADIIHHSLLPYDTLVGSASTRGKFCTFIHAPEKFRLHKLKVPSSAEVARTVPVTFHATRHTADVVSTTQLDPSA
jgi:hypothetical protein